MFTGKSTLALVLAFLYIFGIASADASCGVTVKQTLSTTWTSNDGTFSLVQVTLNNLGTSAVKALTLSSSAELQSFWEMNTVAAGEIVLPDWRIGAGINVGETHSWGYIIKARQAADIIVTNVECVDGSTQGPSTQAPSTQAPTKTPTQAATQAPTRTPTQAPTRRPTSAPTTRPTSRPSTQAPTTRPTSRPSTQAPSTPAPTKAPTTKPGSGSGTTTGGRICPDGQIWSPSPLTTWQWQLTGTIDTSINAQMYDIDMFDASTATIQALHAKGRVVICYFSTQYENWRPDASSFTSAVLGSNLDDWPGERYVDIRSTVVRNIMSARLDLAKSKGCDGVEPDNVDGYTNKNGLGLTANDQLDFNKFLAQQAHSRGLSVGLKNDIDQVKSLVTYFDWALNEQCNQFSECDSLTPFVTAGKAVFGTEYSGSASSFCSKTNSQKFSWLLKDLNLDAKVTQCCTSASGGCTPAPYQCLTPNQRRSAYAEEFVPDAELQAIEAALAANPFEDEEIVAEAELAVEPEAEFVEEVYAEPVEEVVA